MRMPKLRFKDDDGGEFSEWIEKILGDTLSIFSGYAFSSNHSQSYGVKWLKIADVGIQKMVPDNPSYLPFELRDKYKNFLVFKDDYVVALTRPILNGELKIARVDQYYDGSLLNQRVGKLVSNEVIDFVYFLLQLKNTVSQITDTISGTDPPNLSLNEIKGIKLRIPSDRAEQTKIANFLTVIDEKITQLTQKCDLLAQYKKGVMQQIFSQKLRFKDDDGHEFPEWEEKELKDIAYINPKTHSLPDEFIYIDLESVEKGILLKETKITRDDAPSRAQRLLEKNDVLFQMVRPYQKNNLFFDKTGKYVASTGYAQIRANENSRFLYHCLHLDNFISEVMNRCTGTSYPAISSNDLASIPLLVPSLPEQTKIANFLTAIDDKITQAQAQLEAVKRYKKGLLQQLFV